MSINKITAAGSLVFAFGLGGSVGYIVSPEKVTPSSCIKVLEGLRVIVKNPLIGREEAVAFLDAPLVQECRDGEK